MFPDYSVYYYFSSTFTNMQVVLQMQSYKLLFKQQKTVRKGSLFFCRNLTVIPCDIYMCASITVIFSISTNNYRPAAKENAKQDNSS